MLSSYYVTKSNFLCLINGIEEYINVENLL